MLKTLLQRQAGLRSGPAASRARRNTRQRGGEGGASRSSAQDPVAVREGSCLAAGSGAGGPSRGCGAPGLGVPTGRGHRRRHRVHAFDVRGDHCAARRVVLSVGEARAPATDSASRSVLRFLTFFKKQPTKTIKTPQTGEQSCVSAVVPWRRVRFAASGNTQGFASGVHVPYNIFIYLSILLEGFTMRPLFSRRRQVLVPALGWPACRFETVRLRSGLRPASWERKESVCGG